MYRPHFAALLTMFSERQGPSSSRTPWFDGMRSSMSTLVEQIGKEPRRPAVISDCAELIDRQVKQKNFVIKTAYATIKAIKKGFITETVDALLDDWLGKLQPHYDKWATAKQSSFSDYLIA